MFNRSCGCLRRSDLRIRATWPAHGNGVERRSDATNHISLFDSIAEHSLRTWVHHPANRPKLVRQALSELVASLKLREYEERMIKGCYIDMINRIDWGDQEHWLQKDREKQIHDYQLMIHEADWRWFFKREPERSRRLFKIAFANWLAHRAIDPKAMPDVHLGAFLFWNLDARAPVTARMLTAEEVTRWHESTIVLNQIADPMILLLENHLNAIRLSESMLLHEFAVTLFKLEHGRNPKSWDELIKASPHEFHNDVREWVQSSPDWTLRNPSTTTPATAPDPLLEGPIPRPIANGRAP